jgi:hypothetical protein
MLTTLHVIILILTIIVVLFADHEAFDYLRGKKPLLSRQRLELFHRLVWVGLAGMIVTGVLLFLPRRTYLLGDPVFYLKMLFVGFLIVNATVIGQLMHVATKKGYAELSKRERNTIMASGAISFLSWSLAVMLGLLIA